MNTIDLLKELIRIPSVSRTQSGIEDFVADYVGGDIQELTSRGKPCGGNVVAISEPHPGKPFILLNGHHDTVAPAEGWNTDPFDAIPIRDPETHQVKLHGLGSHDMKAGLAIIMELFLEHRDRLNLIFTSAGDEETDSMGSFALTDREDGPLAEYLNRISGALITEPTSERIMLGARGRYALKLTIHGKACHGARPYLGISAVEKAADVIRSLRSLPLDHHPVLGSGSYCILGVEGGTRTLSVPDHCEIVVDRHITQPMTGEEVISELHGTLKDLDVNLEISLVDREVPFLKPYACHPDDPFISSFVGQITGAPSSQSEQTGSTDPSFLYGESVGDYNIFGNLVPTIVYGPRGGHHHSANEYVWESSVIGVHDRLSNWLDSMSFGDRL